VTSIGPVFATNSAFDPAALRPAHLEREEFTVLEDFIGGTALGSFVAEANALRPRINRNYVPGIKKGGSVSYFDVRRHAPAIHALYHSGEFIGWLERLTGESLLTCPESDPHACALYYYTEEGDHIGWHYDTSFYRGKRFTVLLGLVQQSRSELVARLYHKSAERAEQEVRVASQPGTLVVFNGDRCWHMVTPCGAGEDRVMLSMEYVTDRHMGLMHRVMSTAKDTVGYFGIKALFRGR
jgi:hypothetical protein